MVSLADTIFESMLPVSMPYGGKWSRIYRFQQSLLNNPCAPYPPLDMESKWLLYKKRDGSWTPDYFSQFTERHATVLAYGTKVYQGDGKMRQDFLGLLSTFVNHFGTKDLVPELYPALEPVITIFNSFKEPKNLADRLYKGIQRSFYDKMLLGLQSGPWNSTQCMQKRPLGDFSNNQSAFISAEMKFAITITLQS